MAEHIQRLRGLLAAHPRLLLASTGTLATVLFVLRLVSSKKKQGKYISNPSEVGSTGATKPEYDVIIVGGGTSGCALAARLSEDPSIRVLLLEAGGSGSALPASRIPSAYGSLFWTDHVWGFRTEPQIYAKGQRRFFPRAKMLGGCSSINAQMAQYGAPGDFDEWAKVISDESWSWKNLRRYFTKFEKYTPDAAYPLVNTAERGAHGPVRVGYFNNVSEHSKAFLRACAQVGIPLVPDFNGSKGTMGASRIMTYVDPKGQRVSSETAYLTPDVLARPNLKVAINAQVTRILFEQSDGALRAVGVAFAQKADGPRYQARAKEVVLSAGAIHSPHILMLSGVGSAKQLAEFQIPVMHDLPGVGANLVDHPVVDLYLKDKLNVSARILRPNSVGSTLKLIKAVAQYTWNGKGMLASNFGESAAFVRSDDPVLFSAGEFPDKLEDSTSGPGSPDLEIFCTPMAYKEHGAVLFKMHTFALHCYLIRPTSRGAVLLKSADPWAMPSVNANFLKSPDDLEKLARGFRLLLNIAHAKAMDGFLDHNDRHEELDHSTYKMTHEEIRDIVRDRVETVYHPTSTCRMAPEAEEGVVDAKLRVYGIKGLRICDASVFPFIISGHTAGGCFAIAEKLADEMKAEFKAR
ncbi:hypothetical protein FB45DRAFT_6397 [Roridomyces roridus]|uniref:Glucose-methanol-choline oxidoreductase N-terminal domain-containing protein n=1 Tax=Roridomyces roridus TaxID=1738132 RepID=A0AAD7FY60_9AGAR|nr:hypothetical protein FB45DRAFT_6397 [Roridomyces roridus]